MKIYLIRHAPAVDPGPHSNPEQVHLSQEGRRIARAVGRALRQEGVEVYAMLSSPLPRAVQTAERIADLIDYLGVIESFSGLAPEASPRVIAAELATRAVDTAVIGHEPLLAALGALLVNRPSFPPLKRGQVSLIEDGDARWWLDPDTLQKKPLLLA